MPRIAPILPLLLALSAPAWAQSGFLDRAVTVGGVVHRYQVYVPAEPAPGGKPCPIILDLHGKGPEGFDGLGQTEADATVPVEQSRRLVAALKAADADVTYRENPAAGT